MLCKVFETKANTLISNTVFSFQKISVKVDRPASSTTYEIHNILVSKLKARLRVCMSHISDCILNHSFLFCVNYLSCSAKVKSGSYFSLYGHYFFIICVTLLNELTVIDLNIKSLSRNLLVELLVCGNSKFDANQTAKVLNTLHLYCEFHFFRS